MLYGDPSRPRLWKKQTGNAEITGMAIFGRSGGLTLLCAQVEKCVDRRCKGNS
jgi:hypothetical protein